MVYIEDSWFKDEKGRTLILRGANLGGSSKVPYTPDGATYKRDGFFDHKKISFVGRPFPLDEADEHFTRLREWGLTFLRLLTTWEAVEHAGPGQYDENYLDYFRAVVEKAAEYKINVFIDPHQDVWSRFTGGDGAPGWTLEAVGMDITKLHTAGAAFVHAIHGDPYPRMIWPSNYIRLATGTMFTLFFAGDDFAPKTIIDGMPVQAYLQEHYINAMRQVAMRLCDLDNVVGYDMLNEPWRGFIGNVDLNTISQRLLRTNGPAPTPFQSMLLGAGYPQEVVYFEGGSGEPNKQTTRIVNPDGISIWREGYEPIWKQNDVWTDKNNSPQLLKPDYFTTVTGRVVDFVKDYLKPFAHRYIKAVREIHPGALLFMEGAPDGTFTWGLDDPKNTVHADHWYDALTLYTKHYDPHRVVYHDDLKIVEVKDKRAFFVEQLSKFRQRADDLMGGIPTLIGEFGTPFDLDDKESYETGDYSEQITFLDNCYNAMDANLLSCTIWNYTADNTNKHGDKWNDEDLSIFSRDQQKKPDDIHSGGRASEAVIRPYARATAGEPMKMYFELPSRVFKYQFRSDPTISAPTELFIPDYQYPNGYEVELSVGSYVTDREIQVVKITVPLERDIITVCVRPKE